ncbi:hypothetical protein ISCGN_021677 [Ixodes scapularis]
MKSKLSTSLQILFENFRRFMCSCNSHSPFQMQKATKAMGQRPCRVGDLSRRFGSPSRLTRGRDSCGPGGKSERTRTTPQVSQSLAQDRKSVTGTTPRNGRARRTTPTIGWSRRHTNEDL